MSIALIAYYLGPRLGIGHYLERLLPPLMQELSDRKIEATILASPNAWEQTPAIQKLAEVVRIIPQLDSSPSRRYLWVATHLTQYCRREGIQAVAWLTNPIVLPWHPPTLAVIHDVNEWKAATKGWQRTILRSLIYLDASIAFADKIVAISEATKNDLLFFRPQKRLRQKLKVIPQGIDSQLIDLPPVPIPSTVNPFLLCVGRIDPAAKRLPETVKLVEAMRQQSDRPWELHLVGGMNESTQAAGEAFLKSIRDLPWVHYHGYVEDEALAEWYRRAAAVVFLSDGEGFGFPVAEAYCFNRWAIVNRVNQAAIEAGGKGIIAIDLKDLANTDKVISKLQEKLPPQNNSFPRWQTVAAEYATELAQFK